MREMRAVGPLRYGPTGGTTCVHRPIVVAVPPAPASETYRSPFRANVRPRGNWSPVAKIEAVAAPVVLRDAAGVVINAGDVLSGLVPDSHATAEMTRSRAGKRGRHS